MNKLTLCFIVLLIVYVLMPVRPIDPEPSHDNVIPTYTPTPQGIEATTTPTVGQSTMPAPAMPAPTAQGMATAQAATQPTPSR